MFGGGPGGGVNALGANGLFGAASADVSEVPNTSQMAMIPIVNPAPPHLEEDKEEGGANDGANQSNALGSNGETGQEQPLRAPNVITNADDQLEDGGMEYSTSYNALIPFADLASSLNQSPSRRSIGSNRGQGTMMKSVNLRQRNAE